MLFTSTNSTWKSRLLSFPGTVGNKKDVIGPQLRIMLVAFQHLRQVDRNFFASVLRGRVFPNHSTFGGGGLHILG